VNIRVSRDINLIIVEIFRFRFPVSF